MKMNHHRGWRHADVAAVYDRRISGCLGGEEECGGHRPPLQGLHGARHNSGSVLIIVMWIAFGVVSLALYFAHSMEMNMRAADNQVSSLQADQAIESGAVYYSNVLAQMMQITTIQQMNMQPYMLPPTNVYQTAGVRVGEAMMWVIGRDTNDTDFSHRSADPVFGLVDEASKINLNNTKLYKSPDLTTSTNLLQGLPRMTAALLGALYDWNSTNTTASMNGAKSQMYEGLNPPYECKNTNFDTVGELRMVYGMNLEIIYGEDANLNGALDPNENDGQALPPNDNANGMVDPGLIEYFTVYTQEPTNIGTTNRICVTNTTALTNFIGTNYPSIYSQISAKMRTLSASPANSVLDFVLKSGISESDFITIEPFLYGTNMMGLININTATAVALGCIPGIGSDSSLGVPSINAQTIVSFRQSNPSRLNSIYWLKDAMANQGTNAMRRAGPWITSHSW